MTNATVTTTAPATATATARMAAELLTSIATALPTLGEVARDEAFAAIDAFVVVPAPANYLAAMRQIAELRRISRRTNVNATMAQRAHARAITALASLPAIDAATQATLGASIVDAHTGQRLFALAEMVRAHQALAARVRRADVDRRPMNDRLRTTVAATSDVKAKLPALDVTSRGRAKLPALALDVTSRGRAKRRTI